MVSSRIGSQWKMFTPTSLTSVLRRRSFDGQFLLFAICHGTLYSWALRFKTSAGSAVTWIYFDWFSCLFIHIPRPFIKVAHNLCYVSILIRRYEISVIDTASSQRRRKRFENRKGFHFLHKMSIYIEFCLQKLFSPIHLYQKVQILPKTTKHLT